VNNYKDLNNLLSQTDNLMTSSTSYMALDELVKMRSNNGAKNESQSLKCLQTVYKTDIKECSENKSGLPSRSCEVSNSCSSDMTTFSSITTMSSIPSTEDIDEFISDEDLQSKKNNVPATVSQDALLGHHKISARKYGFFKRIGKQFRIDEFISDEDLQSKKNNVPATVSQDALLGHHKISARKYGFFKRIGKQFRKLLTW